MGYEVHISRKPEWSEEVGPEITIRDWLSYVESDPEMRLDGFAEAETADGQTIRVEDSGLAVWTAYSGHGVEGNMAWFGHYANRVSVKNPDEEILRKMYQVAQVLDASVQGDDGETYNSEGISAWADEQPSVKKHWWQFWK